MATYQWRANLKFNSDTSLSYGVFPTEHMNWQDAQTGETYSGAWNYWYRDTNVAGAQGYTDADSSRVVTNVSQTWSATVDNLNNITVTVNVTVNNIVRDDLRGTNADTPCRDINLYKEQGGTSLLSLQDCSLASAHTIYSGPLVLDFFSFTIPPGGNYERSTLFLHNQTTGATSYDDIWCGVQFRNTLPLPTTYTLNYDANGGTGAPAAQTTTTGQSSASFVVPNTAPTWGLYEFLGWSSTQYLDSRTEADVEYRAGDTVTLTSANPTKTLYAVWRMDYRPGAVYDNSVWQSHNRPTGKCHVYSGSKYDELRTIGAPTAMGNPPSVYHNSKWYNMARIGKNKG